MKLSLNLILSGLCLLSPVVAVAQIANQTNDADILGVVSAIDQGEIQMAQMAEGEDLDRHVWEYARMLESDHKKNLDQIARFSKEWGIEPSEKNEAAAQLQTQGQQDMSELSGLHQDDFARKFIVDMIKGHSDVMVWLDGQRATDRRVQRFLDETKDVVAKHLKKAQELKDSMPG